MTLIQLAERRWLPDGVIRYGMRRLLRQRLAEQERLAAGQYEAALDRFADQMRSSVVTIETHRANEQHYEVPAEFFEIVLGKHLKYSCGWWDGRQTTLDESESAMLSLTCKRAGIENGMRVLDLGCGWGSLTLWIAEQFPDCQIVSLSNSAGQRAWIENQCRTRGLANVQVITADVGEFETHDQFDRVVSVEMFEHVRNHEQLLQRISHWLAPGGKLFVHIFCHRNLAYTFETEGDENWMGRHFFTGGMMPAEELFYRFKSGLKLVNHWWINGRHYARTCQAWLDRLDRHESDVGAILSGNSPNHLASDSLPAEKPEVLVQRWRMFFMACEELFRYDRGNQWGVGHYLFECDSNGKSAAMSN